MRNTTWKRIFVLLALMALVLAACQRETPTVDTTEEPMAKPTFGPDTYMAEIVKKGKVTIGVKFDIPQFGFLNPATSKPEGFDVDLGNLIAEKLGVEAEFVEAISA